MKISIIKKNVIYKFLYQILSVCTPLITAPYISRVLGADGIGIYSYTASIMTYFTMFAALGTATYGTREIARTRDNKTLMSKTFFEIEFITMITTAFALFIWILLIIFSSKYSLYYICLIPLLLSVAFDISWLYTALEKVQYTVLWNSLCKIIGLILLFLLIKEKSDLPLYILLMTSVTLLANISMWIYLPNQICKVPLNDLNIYIHFKQTFKYFITSIAISIYTVFDKSMLGFLTSDPFQSGYYEQAYKIIAMIQPFAFSSINDVMSPRMSYLFENENKEQISSRTRKSLDVEFLISIGCSFGIIAVSSNFVPLFFGDGYLPVINLLNVMSLILIPVCFSTCLGSHIYVPSGNIVKATKLTIVGSIVNLIINIPLIILFNSMGAVISTLIAESIIGILYAYNCKTYLSFRWIIRMMIPKIIAGSAMCIVVIVLGKLLSINILLEFILQIIFGILIYILLLFIFKEPSLIEIKNLIRKKF